MADKIICSFYPATANYCISVWQAAIFQPHPETGSPLESPTNVASFNFIKINACDKTCLVQNSSCKLLRSYCWRKMTTHKHQRISTNLWTTKHMNSFEKNTYTVSPLVVLPWCSFSCPAMRPVPNEKCEKFGRNTWFWFLEWRPHELFDTIVPQSQ